MKECAQRRFRGTGLPNSIKLKSQSTALALLREVLTLMTDRYNVALVTKMLKTPCAGIRRLEDDLLLYPHGY